MSLKAADIAVIGAGPAGMTAAVTAARAGKKVLLLEHMDAAGKKILSTGNGKCNLSNLSMSPRSYETSDPDFVRSVLSSFGPDRLIVFLNSIGIPVRNRNGFLYPLSEQAAFVRQALVRACAEAGVKLLTNVQILELKKLEEGFLLKTDGAEFSARKVIFAPGGLAAPQTGSDGSAYSRLTSLGIKVTPFLPALVQLKSSSSLCKKLAGVRTDAGCRLFVDELPVREMTGELQCTDYGLSGFPIFQLSIPAIRALAERKRVQIEVDLLPEISSGELTALLQQFCSSFPDRPIGEIAAGLLPRAAAEGLLWGMKVQKEEAAAKFSADLKRLADGLKKQIFEITGYNGFDRAQTSSGGVAVSQIDPASMQAFSLPGLYFAGECMDVTGLCGGYNLHWAFATGWLAGKSAADCHADSLLLREEKTSGFFESRTTKPSRQESGRFKDREGLSLVRIEKKDLRTEKRPSKQAFKKEEAFGKQHRKQAFKEETSGQRFSQKKGQ